MFIDKKFINVPLKRLRLVREAKVLYPKHYHLDLLFVTDYHDYKFQKDLRRGSKKLGKSIGKIKSHIVKYQTNNELNEEIRKSRSIQTIYKIIF